MGSIQAQPHKEEGFLKSGMDFVCDTGNETNTQFQQAGSTSSINASSASGCEQCYAYNSSPNDVCRHTTWDTESLTTQSSVDEDGEYDDDLIEDFLSYMAADEHVYNIPYTEPWLFSPERE